MRGRSLSATAEPAPKRALPMARKKAKTVRSKDGVAPDMLGGRRAPDSDELRRADMAFNLNAAEGGGAGDG